MGAARESKTREVYEWRLYSTACTSKTFSSPELWKVNKSYWQESNVKIWNLETELEWSISGWDGGKNQDHKSDVEMLPWKFVSCESINGRGGFGPGLWRSSRFPAGINGSCESSGEFSTEDQHGRSGRCESLGDAWRTVRWWFWWEHTTDIWIPWGGSRLKRRCEWGRVWMSC